MAQLTVLDYLQQQEDIAKIYTVLQALQVGEEYVTSTITVRRFKYYEIETADLHECFQNVKAIHAYLKQFA